MALQLDGAKPPSGSASNDFGNRWAARPGAAKVVNGAVLLIPLAASVVTGVVAARLLPEPAGWTFVPWLLAVLGSSVGASLAADRVARRLLPLAALLRLSLVFPDRTPSRFAIALRAGTTRRLNERVVAARDHGIDPEPGRAAATILSLVASLAAHEPRTRGHSERVRAFTDLIGEELGLSVDDRDRLRWAALIHDIGKLETPADVLTKPGKLDDHEFEAIRRHPADGARIAAPLRAWLGPWAEAIEHHHERWDGKGYPLGLAGTDISLGGRIVAVADAFEVMTAGRTYQTAVDFPAARAEMARCAGGQFDPEVVRAFLRVSLPRLRWAMGALSSVSQLPRLLEHLPRAAMSARAAQTAGSVALSTAAALGVLVVPTSLPAPPASTESAEALAPAQQAVARSDRDSRSVGGSLNETSDSAGTSDGDTNGSASDAVAPATDSESPLPTPTRQENAAAGSSDNTANSATPTAPASAGTPGQSAVTTTTAAPRSATTTTTARPTSTTAAPTTTTTAKPTTPTTAPTTSTTAAPSPTTTTSPSPTTTTPPNDDDLCLLFICF